MDQAVSIERRLAAMKKLHDAGIRTSCFMSPIFPEITDVEAIIDRVKNQCNFIWLENLNLRGSYKNQKIRKERSVTAMPELPEIEEIKRVIEPQIKGLAVQRITANRPEVIAHPSADEFCRRIIGQVFVGIQRRGKFLILCMESGDRLLLHLRMTGCLLMTPTDYPEEKHTHLVFHLSGGKELRFSDTRRLGRFWLLRQGESDIYSGIEKLGAEPFDPSFSGEYLFTRLGKRKKAIKECLLDQNVIAGIGNIYSDEILFTAHIHPERPANTLTKEEWNRLAFFIEKNETAPEEYLETKGQDYRNTPFLQVYGHSGEPCPVCGESLCRKVIGGRSSEYCPICQK